MTVSHIGNFFLDQSNPATSNAWTVSVTKKSCATGYYSFGHEIGHNFGAHHNPEIVNNNYYYDGHAHLIDKGIASNSTGYRTILAYNAAGHEKRVNYYSNPSVIFPPTNTPTGVVGIFIIFISC